MCGLAGFLDSVRATDADGLQATALRMADTLRHRGPNDRGAWVDPAAGVALGFRRLAIVDLSVEGHQPMESATGRFVLVFNGEVYNYEDLRRDVKQQANGSFRPFRGHSDTEVMLAAFEHWGVEAAVRRFIGMFAFALWDRKEQALHLCRDRLGEKPLYYGWMGPTFLFGSELKALRAHPDFRGTIRRDAMVPYLRHGYVPTPCSIYENIDKLPPGTLLTVKEFQPGVLPAPRPYWSARASAEVGAACPFRGNESAAAERLEAVLREVIGQQMVADVPLGAFLSGGVDSSTVVALMQAQSPRPVKTFTIGFHQEEFDEAAYAKAVARHLGTDHTEVYVTPEESLAVIPRLPVLYDEPFADSSQIPTFLVSQVAARAVTVSLSGDGGDEVFAGYPWYARARQVWNRVRRVPRGMRRLAAATLGGVSTNGWDRTLNYVQPLLPRSAGRFARADSLHKLAAILDEADHLESLHQRLIATWNGSGAVLGAEAEPRSRLTDPAAWADLHDETYALQCFDMLTYLPDDILVKVDRASMGASLEARAPFLDQRVVEFAWRVPLAMKVRRGQRKWLLRQVLYKHVPRQLIERPKKGFEVPVAAWLRGPLREWAESLLEPRLLRAQGFFAADLIRQQWQEHLSGERDWQSHLWHILMFQGWLQAQ